MSQSPLHKPFFISDLEWFVMPPILHKQFRLFYAKNKPVGVVMWACVNDEMAKHLAEKTSKLRPQDWKSGEQLRVVEAFAPFGGPDEMIKNLKAQVFSDKELRYLAMTADGKKEVKVL